MSQRKSALQRILERREKNRPSRELTPESRDEGEVLIAWVTGDIETREAADALELKTTSQIACRAGTVLRNLATAKHISITWNVPLDELESEEPRP